jgi:hypothetical protein
MGWSKFIFCGGGWIVRFGKIFSMFLFFKSKIPKNDQKSSKRCYNGHFGHFRPKIAKLVIIVFHR